MKPKRIKALEFHVRSGDYFVTAATLLSLVSHELARHGLFQGGLNSEIQECLAEMEEDFLFLQRHFTLQRTTLFCPPLLLPRSPSSKGRYVPLPE